MATPANGASRPHTQTHPQPNGARHLYQPPADEGLSDGVLEFDSTEPAEPQTAPQPRQRQPQPAPQVAAAQHDPMTVELALTYGADMVQINATDPARLKQWVFEQRRHELRQRQMQPPADFDRQAAEFRQQFHPQAAPATPSPAAAEAFDLDPEQYDPGLVAALKKRDGEIAALRKQIEADRQTRGQRDQMTALERVDDAFAMLDRADLFGELSGFEADPQSAEMYRRRAVLAAAKIDLANPPAAKVILNRLRSATGILFGEPQRAAGRPDDPGNPYSAAHDGLTRPAAGGSRHRDARGRFVPGGQPEYTEDEWMNAGLRRPTSRDTGDAPAMEQERSGYAAPGEFGETSFR